jgi:hypothetical protein
MAGIFSDVTTDIQKLRQLKAEIENVKKALKSIDVNVNIDIAKGMEAQLQSLTKQYDALVKKVSEAEGKIMISTQRINDASEKIIKAQEQLSKAAGMNAQSGNANATAPANQTETASVQAQAKAYDELAAEIDDVLGTRTQNIKRMIEEQRAIDLIKKEIKELTKYQTENSTLSATQQRRLEQLNNSLLTHKAALSEVKQTLMNNAKLDNAASTSMNGLSQSLSRMRITYRELTEEERNSPFGKELLTSINQADAKIKELDAKIGNHQRNIGNYAKAYNGLNVSVQQIVRELPSAAMGLNMFFLAISNNLPILTDEIKRAKDRNAELIAQNQKATPVWKQLVSSIFSWQSAMMVGITLLTVYGKDIWEWIRGLSKAKEAIIDMISAEQEMAIARKKASESIKKEQAELDMLYRIMKNSSNTMEQRKSAYADFVSLYPKYANVMENEKINIGKLNTAYKELTKSIKERAVAESYMNTISELSVKRENEEIKRLNQKLTVSKAEERYRKAQEEYNNLRNRQLSGESVGQLMPNIRSEYLNAQEDYLNQKKLYDDIVKNVENYTSKIEAIEKHTEKLITGNKENPKEGTLAYLEQEKNMLEAQLKSLTEIEAKGEKGIELRKKIADLDKRITDAYSVSLGTKRQKKDQQNLAEALLQLRFQNQQDEINLMQEGSEKKRKQIELDYKKELAEIKKLEKEWSEENGGKLTQDQSVEISIKYSNAENKRKEGLSGLVEEEQQKLQSMLEKYQDYAAQREAIEKQLNEDITYLETQRTEENSANIDRAIKVAKEKAAKAVKEITDEESKALVNDSGIFARLFSDSSSMTKASLKKVIAEAKTLVDYLSGISIEKPLGFTEDQLEALKGDAESIKEIYDALIEKQDELDKRTDYPFDGIVKGFRKIKESSELAKRAIEETNEEKKKLLQSQSEAEYGKGVSYLKDGALEASDAVGFLAEQVSILAEATGDAKFKEFSDQFSAFSQNLQAAGQGAQSGGWIGAIVGGASNMITQTVASMAQLQSEAYEYEQNRIDFLREIEKISLSLKDEDYDSIFGTSSIEKARDAYDLAREALEKYNEELQRTSALELEEEYKNLGAAIFAPIFGSFGFGKRISEETKALMAAYEKGYTDLQAMAVKTKDRSGWANFWGKKDEYTALKDLAPELWNEDGTFNVEAAQAFLDTNTQISDEQRKQIQNVIDLKNAYDENIAIIDELLASTFGSLGSDITDIIFDSVRNGTDAWEQFREVGSEIIDELGRQMIQELYVQTYLETFKERMRAAYGLDSVEDTQKELANIMNDIYNGLEGVLDGASSAAEEWDKWAKDHGFTPGEEDTESSSQTATRKGFTTMSQDTADELNGRFTALYESNLRLETIGQQQAIAITELRGPISSLTAQASGMYNIADETRTILANSYLELQQIRENTGEIVKPIKQMQADIAEVKRNTSRL